MLASAAPATPASVHNRLSDRAESADLDNSDDDVSQRGSALPPTISGRRPRGREEETGEPAAKRAALRAEESDDVSAPSPRGPPLESPLAHPISRGAEADGPEPGASQAAVTSTGEGQASENSPANAASLGVFAELVAELQTAATEKRGSVFSRVADQLFSLRSRHSAGG